MTKSIWYRVVFAVVLLSVGPFVARAYAQVAQHLPDPSGIAAAAVSAAVPVERRLAKLSKEALADIKVMRSSPTVPTLMPGGVGTIRTSAKPALFDPTTPAQGRMERPALPQNYGRGNLNSFYHYSDHLVDTELLDDYPIRPTGWFLFKAADNAWYRCTASLISRSILATAGHCVHQGGNGSAGWNKEGYFYPAYTKGAKPFGEASAAYLVTTDGWFRTGALDQGYDVGLVVLRKRAGTSKEIGSYTGWYGFCTAGCLQSYWSLTQLGYPGNYYAGRYLTEGHHMARSDSRDYLFGSGMQGGSSGGPHLANIGELDDSSTDKGQSAARNVLFAVTSWGYIDPSFKIQGASSLSGPGNANNFRGMWNKACSVARSLHGPTSCKLL